MNTAVGDIEPDRKALRMRSARHQREARIRFWRVFVVSSFFVVALSANLYIGAVVVMGNIGGQSAVAKVLPGDGRAALVKRPLLDGTFCRTIVFDNNTANSMTDKVERCDKPADQPRGRTRTQFSWGGR